jgi:hypothetical protein
MLATSIQEVEELEEPRPQRLKAGLKYVRTEGLRDRRTEELKDDNVAAPCCCLCLGPTQTSPRFSAMCCSTVHFGFFRSCSIFHDRYVPSPGAYTRLLFSST